MSRLSPPALAAWLAWAACAVTLFAMVDRFAGKSPHFDDVAYFGMNLLPKNFAPAGFWHPVNEHRVPLPKFASWALMRGFGYNPRLVMRFDIALMAGGVAALMLAARRIRGRTRAADALFPLVLLSPGQAENFLWAVQVNFLVPAALAAVAAALVAGCGPALGARRAALVGAAAVLLALCGIQGQFPALALAAWLVGWGAIPDRLGRCSFFPPLSVPGRGSQTGPTRPARRVALAGGALALALALICLAAFERPANVPPPQWGVRPALYAARVLGGAWGPVSEVVGPGEPGPLPAALGLLTTAVVTVAFGVIARALPNRADRPAATGLAALLLATSATCAGVGFGRGALNGWALAERYVTLAAPLVSLSYLAAVRFPAGRFTATYADALALIALALAWPNAEAGLATARARRDHQRLIEADARRGVPPSFFVDHHGAYVFPPDPSEVAVVFEALRAMRIPPYAAISPEPVLREVPAGWRVETVPQPGDGGWCDAPAGDAIRGAITLRLPPGARAIRIDYSAVGTPGPLTSELSWHDPATQAVRDFFEPGVAKSKRAWLGGPVGRAEFRIDGPVRFRVERVAALVADPPP